MSSKKYGIPGLKRLREEAGWTQSELSVYSRVSVSSVNVMEHGEGIHVALAGAIARTLADQLGRSVEVQEIPLPQRRSRTRSRSSGTAADTGEEEPALAS